MKLRTVHSVLPVVTLLAWANAQNPVYREHVQPIKAKLTILAVSSVVHMISGNQDTYVAELVAPKDGSPTLAKLVDRYRGADDPIRRVWLVQLHPLEMRLIRDEGCDLEANLVHMPRTDADIFDVRVRDTLRERGPEVLPCYLVDHKATRLAN